MTPTTPATAVSLSISLPWFIFTVIIYAALTKLRKPLRPPYIAFELASEAKHAFNILVEWRRRDMNSRAFVAVIVDAVLVPCYLLATEALLYSILDLSHAAGIVWTTIGFMFAVFLAAMANWAADLILLVELMRGKPWMATAARICGKFKYIAMATTLLYIIFRGEVYVYGHVHTMVHPAHWRTMVWTVGGTLILAFFVYRRLASFSQRYPTLLSLQLAPDRLTAKGILERWGLRGRRSAGITLLLQSGLALLLGVILATACRNTDVGLEVIQKAGGAIAWLALITAACHLGQNLGAFIAVSRGEMGWWVDMMRRIGKVRIILTALVALYFVVLIVGYEAMTVTRWGRWVSIHTPKIPLPWT
jgi:hypothetical protein